MPDETLVEEVHAPNGGLVDTVQLDLLRGSDAQIMVNMHHDRLALERRAGYTIVGATATPHPYCYGGFHYRQIAGTGFICRVQGPATPDIFNRTYLYVGTGSNWLGAQSRAIGATDADYIGNGQYRGNGTFVQYADRLYWHDGGTEHRLFDGAHVQNYGRLAGTFVAAGTLSAYAGATSGNPYCFSLDGSTYLSLGVTGINGATDYTFSCWVQASSTAVQGLMGAWKDGTHFAYTFINSQGVAPYRGEFELKIGASYAHAQSFLVNDGEWHLLTGVRSGNQISLYRDGNIGQTKGCPTGALQATAFYVGGTRYSAGLTHLLVGLIDDIRVYSRALSTPEIVGLYLGTEPDTSGLVAWWKLNEGSGSTISDSSPGGTNGGTVVGNAVWSADAPSQITSGGSSGSLQAGTYKFLYTVYNPVTAEESPASEVSNGITLGTANGSLLATVAYNTLWLTYGFTIIRYYRTTVDGAAYLFDHEITMPVPPGGVGNFSEVLSRADETLGAEVEYTRGAVPRMRYAILFNEMVVGAGVASSPSTLYWSAVGDPSHWPPAYAQDIDRDNGDPITGIFRLMGRLFVLKQTSGVYMLTPQTDSTGAVSFQVDHITGDFGCLSHHSIQVIDTYAYWADAKGIVRFNGQQCENISDPKIRYLWKQLASNPGSYGYGASASAIDALQTVGLHQPALDCYAVHDRRADKNYYRLTIDATNIDGAGTTRKWLDLVYDLSIGCWFLDGYPTATQVAAIGDVSRIDPYGYGSRVSWLVKDALGQYHVHKADLTGRCFRLRTEGNAAPPLDVYTDAGFATPSQWKSKWFGGMPGVIPKWLEIEYERSEVGYAVGPVTVNLYQDGLTAPGATDSRSLIPYASNSQASTDSTIPDPTRLTHVCRIDWNAEWCRRFAFEILCSAPNTQLRILQFRVGYTVCGATLKAR